MQTIPYVLLALLLIGLIIFIHELGHYIMGRLTGIGIVEFAIGFGPRLISWRRGKTIYSIRLFLPLGGFCKFVGEDEAEHWYAVPLVQGFGDHSPALAAGLKPGDIITAVNDEPIAFDAGGAARMGELVAETGAGPVKLRVQRDGEARDYVIQAQMFAGEPTLGILLGRVDDMSAPRVAHSTDASLQPGDTVIRIGRKYIDCGPSGAFQVERAFQRAGDSPLSLIIERAGQPVPVTVAGACDLVLGNASYPLPGDPDVPPPSNAFGRQPVWKRFLTTFAGPFMNFVLAYVAAVVLLMMVGTAYSMPIVGATNPSQNAAAAGMVAGDVIAEAQGEAIEYSPVGASHLVEIITASDGEAPIDFVVERAGERLDISVMPTKVDDRYYIGIVLGTETVYPSLLPAMSGGLSVVRSASTAILDALRNLVTTGEGAGDTAGPVGLVSIMTQEAQQGGFDNILALLVIISINLGIMNLLPLPALDGGRLVFLIVEGIRRKPVKPEHEAWVHAAGLLMFLILAVVLTYRDIARLFGG